MRVLQLHNFYRSSAPSGENNVVDAERSLLERNAVQLDTFYADSDELEKRGLIGTLTGALATPWNPVSAHELQKRIIDFDPDIVHAHNTFPLLSPSVFHAVNGRAGRVLTLHNYRTVCANGIPMRNNRVCTQCIDQRSVMPALRHGCYRNSRMATLPLALNIMLQRSVGTWVNQVDAFIVLSDFQRRIMAKAGFPEELIHVKPNFLPGEPDVTIWSDRPRSVVFAGRITEEKGIRTLIDVWRRWGSSAPDLRIIGDGDLREALESSTQGLPVTFLGQIPQAEAMREIGLARLLVVPSEWYEGFPMVLQEAFAHGTPAAVSNIGALPDIIEYGRAGGVFEPNDPMSMLSKLQSLWSDQSGLEQKGAKARDIFESKYMEAQNLTKLLEIYRTAIAVKKDRGED